MDEALDACAEPSKGTEIGKLGNRAIDEIVDVVVILDRAPGLRLQALDTESNALPFPVDGQNLYVDLVADAQHLAGMRDSPPGEFGKVRQSVASAEIDEGPEGTQAAYHPSADLSFLQFRQQLILPPLAALAHRSPLGENQAIPLPVQFDDPES